MCGRFTLTVDPDQLADTFPWAVISNDIKPRYNISPSQQVTVIPNTGDFQMASFKWGLIPSWAKDPTIGNRMINARAETISEKPSFRNALNKRRCLILADGFYEWMQSSEGKNKTPYYIHLTSGKVFAFAGLWETWVSPEGIKIKTCTIITTQPNSLLEPIHNRMPVILPPESYPSWLEPGEVNPVAANKLLVPYPSNKMEAYPVSRAVNDPKNDTAALIARL